MLGVITFYNNFSPYTFFPLSPSVLVTCIKFLTVSLFVSNVALPLSIIIQLYFKSNQRWRMELQFQANKVQMCCHQTL